MPTAAPAAPVKPRTPRRPRRIDVASVRRELENIAAEFPDREDRRPADGLAPRYIDRGVPNCLVAVALSRLGFTVGMLKALDQEHPVGELVSPGVRIEESRHPALRKLDPAARRLLEYVQQRQDRGDTWRRVVTEAFTPARWFGKAYDRERKPWLYLSS